MIIGRIVGVDIFQDVHRYIVSEIYDGRQLMRAVNCGNGKYHE